MLSVSLEVPYGVLALRTGRPVAQRKWYDMFVGRSTEMVLDFKLMGIMVSMQKSINGGSNSNDNINIVAEVNALNFSVNPLWGGQQLVFALCRCAKNMTAPHVSDWLRTAPIGPLIMFGKTHTKHAVEPRHRPCRPRVPQGLGLGLVRVRVRGGVGLGLDRRAR